MLRQLAGASRDLVTRAAQLGVHRQATTSAASEGSSVASLITAVNSSSAAAITSSAGLAALKAGITPAYGPAAGSSTALSLNAKLVLGAAAGWFLYRADTQARSKDWIVDLSLDVLQAAWLVSFVSFIPFRSVYLSLRGIAPSSAPLTALRPAVNLK